MRNALLTMLTVASGSALMIACTKNADDVTAGPQENGVAVAEANLAQAETAQAGNAVTESDLSVAAPNAAGEAIQVLLEKVDHIPDQPDDQASISDVKFVSGIAGHFITANVRYGGGCREHQFKAYWTGSWSKSNPPGIDITLRHNANGDTCMALFNRLLQINISEPAAAQKNFWVQLTNVAGPEGRVDVKIP
jgi:hypothetical protein